MHMSSLGNDLSLIRKHRGLSLEDIRSTTKIPMNILESIEDDSIFDDPRQNATYIRSYVRSYAKALKIDNEQIVTALDRQKAGRYEGMLRDLLTDMEQKLKGKSRFRLDDEADKPASDAGKAKSDDAGEEKDEGEAKDREEAKEKPADAGMVPPEPEMDPTDSESADPEPETAEERNGARVPDPPVVESVDWANMGKQFIPMQKSPRIWMGIVAAILVLAIAAFFLLYGFGNDSGEGDSPESETSEQQTVTPDSLQLNLSPRQTVEEDEDTGAAGDEAESGEQTEETNPAAAALPDTLSLVIYAAHSQLEPVRVYTDVSNTLNPYWIEQGEAIRFEWVNEIRIRGQYSQMELLFNGHLVEDFREEFFNASTRMVEIDRSFFEGSPRWLQPAPDSLGNGLPAPTVIRERPSFN